MKSGHALAVLVLGSACAAGPATTRKGPAASEDVADYERLAARIVEQSARIQEEDRVLVSGTVDDLPFMEAIAVSVRRRGAFPLLSITSDRLERRYLTDVPSRYDAQPPALELAMASVLSAEISLLPEAEAIYRGVDPRRLAVIASAREHLDRLLLERRVRQISLGNEVYPSQARAERYGIPLPELRRSFLRGLAVEADELRRVAEPLRQRLSMGRELTLTSRNGTSLRLGVDARPILVNDGELTPERLRGGGAGHLLWLPAGEVYFTPVPGTAEGRLVIDRAIVQGERIEGLTLDFLRGALVRMDALSGGQALRASYAAAGPGKERFAMVDIGVNPAVNHVAGSWLPPPVAAGMVSVGVGRDIWVGGNNDANFGVLLALPEATVAIDGRVLVASGTLVP